MLPGGVAVRAAGAADQPVTDQPDWGVYADPCWDGWPGPPVLPWPDLGVPADDDAALGAILEAWFRALRGQDILVGCFGGRGRTGTILSSLAVLAGVPPPCAVDWVRRHYPPAEEVTPAQQQWVTERFARDDRVQEIAARSRMKRIEDRARMIRREAVAARLRPDEAPVLVWAVDGVLAVTQRPLRDDPLYGGSRSPFPPAAATAIEGWIDRDKAQGIRSVIVLTSAKELAYYDAATARYGGLLGLYRHRGLEIEHLPADDPAHDPGAARAFSAAMDEIAEKAIAALRRMRVPALMHCSAAVDRSPPVAARVALFVENCGRP